MKIWGNFRIQQKKRTAGFTLVELLLVIAIIALLAALLMPALQKARAKAQYIACVANYKQMSLAYTMYGTDYKNVPSGRILGRGPLGIRYPYGYDDGRGGGPEIYGFPSALAPYTGKSWKMWRCPATRPNIAVSYHSNNTVLNEIGRGYETVESFTDPSIRIPKTYKNLHRPEVGSLQIIGENNYKPGAYRTGVYDVGGVDDAGETLKIRVFGHSRGAPPPYTGVGTDLHLTADGTVVLEGIWTKWKYGNYQGKNLF